MKQSQQAFGVILTLGRMIGEETNFMIIFLLMEHLQGTFLHLNIMYAFQNVFDATFYGTGRTDYMLFESVVTNTVYYGGFFIAYLLGVWVSTLTGIALMFGFGNAFDSVVSWMAYMHFKKHRIVTE